MLLCFNVSGFIGLKYVIDIDFNIYFILDRLKHFSVQILNINVVDFSKYLCKNLIT